MFLKNKVLLLALPLIVFIIVILLKRPEGPTFFLYLILIVAVFGVAMGFLYQYLGHSTIEIKFKRNKRD